MIEFEWDEGKAFANLKKHGISFQEAIKVFDDPYAVTDLDEINRGETRWRTVGMVEGLLILFVAHTIRDEDGDEIFRIISARRATRKEEQRYATNRTNNP